MKESRMGEKGYERYDRESAHTKKQFIKTQRSTEEAQRREGKAATGHGLSGLSTAEGWALSL